VETTIAELAPYRRGWGNYFDFCETPEALVYLTRWVRLRLRAALWRQWRTPRRRSAALLALEVRPRLAAHTASSGLGRGTSHAPRPSRWGCPMPTSTRSAFPD
jgi:RNA-directed DNA polymerase